MVWCPEQTEHSIPPFALRNNPKGFVFAIHYPDTTILDSPSVGCKNGLKADINVVPSPHTIKEETILSTIIFS